MFPYLDLPGFMARTIIPAGDVQYVEQQTPGYTAQRLAVRSSYMNARLRKRYGNAPTVGNALPLGQRPPALLAAGTNPPEATLTGRPTLGCLQVQLQITTGGPVGTAVFQWSKDGGKTWTTGVQTSALVPLPGTGMSVAFPVGTYGTDNAYAAATPVPETALGWLTAMVTVDVYKKRGRNPSDPAMVDANDDLATALAELKEAADTKEACFDLPASEDLDSAVTTGGPLAYTETSPYVWTEQEARRASREDGSGRGTSS